MSLEYTTNKNKFPASKTVLADGTEEVLEAPGVGRCYHLTGIMVTPTKGLASTMVLEDGNGNELLKVTVPSYESIAFEFPHILETDTNVKITASATGSSGGDIEVYLWGFVGASTS